MISYQDITVPGDLKHHVATGNYVDYKVRYGLQFHAGRLPLQINHNHDAKHDHRGLNDQDKSVLGILRGEAVAELSEEDEFCIVSKLIVFCLEMINLGLF